MGSQVKIRCPNPECRSLDIQITGKSFCACNNCGTKFIFPDAKAITDPGTIIHGGSK